MPFLLSSYVTLSSSPATFSVRTPGLVPTGIAPVRVPPLRYVCPMPICVVCAAWGHGPLCPECRSQLRAAKPVMRSGLVVSSGLFHEKSARRLVHLLKYQGLDAAGVVLGQIMAAQVPPGVSTLVPVPRAWARRLRYGVDPARVLARRVGAIAGVEVVEAVGAEVWWPSHAGSDRSSRRPPEFRLVGVVPPGSALVDDVVTTGATLAAAGRITGIHQALTATRADCPSFE
jgi:predicted amidophosphoribosyltransferase